MIFQKRGCYHKKYFLEEDINISDKDYFSIGLHPWHIKSGNENKPLLFRLEKLCREKKPIAIGECGLDKNIKTPLENQKEVFVNQLLLAEKEGLPVIIHSVKTTDEIFMLREKMKPVSPWIIHGFTGNLKVSGQLLEVGFLFSFGKILLNDNSKAMESFKNIPLDKVFLETDEYKGSVEWIYQKAALIHNMELISLKEIIYQNFNRIFLRK